eukprot:NODE_15315_length_1056_cov_9.235737.p2 GENE.NODE_15315_length_1056_cov_9.235737~~NODE_15315_length_1056_cov_9.235737.p2  ORF type:complete len:230 (-),score=86.99 NODE_15315_length_1056_cov_9.235737:248-937(-)
MKLNISDPNTGCQKMIEVTDEKKLMALEGKRMAQEVIGDNLGPEWAGYIFRVGGGNDKQGFPMMQGVLSNLRSRLLFKKGMKCFRERRAGSRKRKSVRGCIVGLDLAAMSLVIVKKGEQEVPGLTDDVKPRRLGPKRANKIRKLFGLTKKDDVRRYVIRREVKKGTKAPKIQRLITKNTLQRKRHAKSVQKRRFAVQKEAKEEYMKVKAEVSARKRAEQAEATGKKGKK